MDHQKIESCTDVLQCHKDLTSKILECLDDPADLVRASAVAYSWHQLVIENELAKKACLNMYPQLSNIVSIDKMNDATTSSEFNNTSELEILKRDHKVYVILLLALNKSNLSPMDCIETAVWVSSTDNYPRESVVNTLEPSDRLNRRFSYWSSEGQSDPYIPETLMYKLSDGIWLVTEIDIQPFEAFFQSGKPTYSAKSVRFRINYPKSPQDVAMQLRRRPHLKPADDMFEWTYTSPEFPMTQENRLQPFKLPEPVLCMGGYLQIELLGRVQRQEMDGLFYICVDHVRVLGRPLYPAFDVVIIAPRGKLLLKYNPMAFSSVLKSVSIDEITHMR
ncbi:F-box At4g00755-like isoform X5 [Olea europaea subsp. europaea]|nr:F-box At4g00755-like isoform X5 [Olea europaea subsp. europaea]